MAQSKDQEIRDLQKKNKEDARVYQQQLQDKTAELQEKWEKRRSDRHSSKYDIAIGSGKVSSDSIEVH